MDINNSNYELNNNHFKQIENQIKNQNSKSTVTSSKNTEFNFDKLQMYFGEPYTIKCPDTNDITIFQPTIKNILDYKEEKFYIMLNPFVSNTTSYRLQLWNLGIDWNKISDYQLFCILIKRLNKESTSILFGDVDFQLFELCTKQTKDNQEITLYNKEQNLEISEQTYQCISEYLRLMFNIHPKVEKAKGKATKESIIEEEKMLLHSKKDNHFESILLPLISSCINHPGFKYSLNDLKEVGIVQFMDSVQRLQIYESTIALMSGMYSGMVDVKGLDENALNFMRSI